MADAPLDLKSLPENEASARLQAAFEALAAGETLLFSTAAAPQAVIRLILPALWGRFDWAPLDEGGGEWLSQISRREQPGPTGLEDLLARDHQRCDDLFAEAEAAAQAGDQAGAERLFRRLDLGLNRHFTMEEEGFFRDLDDRMGFMGGGPVAVMRDEHTQMRGMLRRMEGALADANLDDYLAMADTMLYLMEQHNMKEEQMLYPMADDALGREMEALLKRLLLF